MKSNIFIVDDHPIVRNGLALLIRQEDDLEVCGEAGTANEAIDAIRRLKPDLALVDISLDGSSGIDLTRAIRAEMPLTAVLVLSMHDEGLYAERALHAGASGYLMKQESPEVVIKAIRHVLGGEIYLSERFKSLLVAGVVEAGRGARDKHWIDRLSNRELEVFHLIGCGLTSRAIAAKLNVSIKTIEAHRTHIKRKLCVDENSSLIQLAIRYVEAGVRVQ